MDTREYITKISNEELFENEAFDILEDITKNYDFQRSNRLLRDLKGEREKILVKLVDEWNTKIKALYLTKSFTKWEGTPKYVIPCYDGDTEEFLYKEVEEAINYSNQLLNKIIHELETKLYPRLNEDTSDNEFIMTGEIIIPPELNCEQAQKYFKRAIENGLMNETYVWLKTNESLAYFVRTMSDRLKIGKGVTLSTNRPRIRWKPFEELIKLKSGVLEPGKLREWNASLERDERLPSNHELIDLIFKD